MSSSTANRRGIVAILLAMVLFTANDTLTKIVSADLPPGEIMATRGCFGVLLMLGLIAARGELHNLGEMKTPIVAMRGLLEASIGFTFLTALAHLQLANITAIMQVTPIMITFLTVMLGLESVKWRRWSAIIVGFLGVLLIVKPSTDGFNVFAGLALASAFLVAVRDLVTRSISPNIPTSIVTLSATATVTVLGFALSASEDWKPVSFLELTTLAAAAFFVTLGNLQIVKAFRSADISVVSPFRYAVIITSLTAGFLVFGELPDLISVLGIVLVVGSGLYTLHREQVRIRDVRKLEELAVPAPGE